MKPPTTSDPVPSPEAAAATDGGRDVPAAARAPWQVLARNRWVTVAGRLAMFGGLIFVGARVWHFRAALQHELSDARLLALTGVSVLAYAALSTLQGTGWWLAQRAFAGRSRALRWREAYRIHSRTQVAKYLPGNVFHFAGRHVRALRLGAENRPLLFASAAEILLMLLAAAGLTVLALPRLHVVLGSVEFRLTTVAFLGFAVALIPAAFIGRRLLRRFTRVEVGSLAPALACYAALLLAVSGLFLGLLTAVSGDDALWAWREVLGGYALSWAIGFVTPGAPAGLGVREAVLVCLLGPQLGRSAVLTAALLMRLVTSLGDVVFFLQAVAFDRRPL